MLEEIKRQSLTKFIVLILITYGTYPLLWLVQNLRHLDTVAGKGKLVFTNAVVLAALWIWSIVFSLLNLNTDGDLSIFFWISLTLQAAFLVHHYNFLTKPFINGLDDSLIKDFKIDFRPNRLWAFLFGTIYIVYAINRADELIQRAKIINPPPNSQQPPLSTPPFTEH